MSKIEGMDADLPKKSVFGKYLMIYQLMVSKDMQMIGGWSLKLRNSKI